MKETVLEYSFSDILNFIGQLVEIHHLHKLPSSVGILVSVDPESLTLLVATSSGSRIVVPSSILAINTVKNPENFDQYNLIVENFRVLKERVEKNDPDNSTQGAFVLKDKDLVNRRAKLLSLLGKQHLPFIDEEGSRMIKVLNCVEVHPPFTPESCFGANEIILSKVKKLVSEL